MSQKELYILAKSNLECIKEAYRPDDYETDHQHSCQPFDEADMVSMDIAISLIDEKIRALEEVETDDTEGNGS